DPRSLDVPCPSLFPFLVSFGSCVASGAARACRSRAGNPLTHVCRAAPERHTPLLATRQERHRSAIHELHVLHVQNDDRVSGLAFEESPQLGEMLRPDLTTQCEDHAAVGGQGFLDLQCHRRWTPEHPPSNPLASSRTTLSADSGTRRWIRASRTTQ